jgi:hypothetical protein
LLPGQAEESCSQQELSEEFRETCVFDTSATGDDSFVASSVRSNQTLKEEEQEAITRSSSGKGSSMKCRGTCESKWKVKTFLKRGFCSGGFLLLPKLRCFAR